MQVWNKYKAIRYKYGQLLTNKSNSNIPNKELFNKKSKNGLCFFFHLKNLLISKNRSTLQKRNFVSFFTITQILSQLNIQII